MLITVAVDLSNLNHKVKSDVVKKDVYNARIKNIEHKTPDIINLATKINEVKKEIPRITNLAITISLYDKINEVKTKYLILLT